MTSEARRVVLLTGGNSGIGFEAARVLARDGWHVVIASRDRAASARAVATLRADAGHGDVEEMALDLGSGAAVRQFAKDWHARGLPLHALVCNAGLQMAHFARSADGAELTFAVNHLGHFLLVNLLLDALRASTPSRVVVVASGVHDPALRTGMPKADVPDVACLPEKGGPIDRPYLGRLAYVNSKLCNLWFTYELVRRLDAAGVRGVAVHAYEPGFVPGSGLARDYPRAVRWIWFHVLPRIVALLPFSSTAPRSGAALAKVVEDPALATTSGKYFPSHTRFAEGKSSVASYDPAPARALWDLSVRLTDLTPDESPLAASPS
jgi:NAD(P)-dependent dehydrogenase (short-subunit alcohol dehydrogenase family)